MENKFKEDLMRLSNSFVIKMIDALEESELSVGASEDGEPLVLSEDKEFTVPLQTIIGTAFDLIKFEVEKAKKEKEEENE